MSADSSARDEQLGHGSDAGRARQSVEAKRGFGDDFEAALTRLLEMTRETVGGAYAALGILDRGREKLQHFLTAGLDSQTRAQIGTHPRGRGVLGLLILDPKPLRIHDLPSDPRSYGFPPGHPVMHSFVGAPILLDGEPCGNLYVAEKQHGAFSEADEHVVTAMADRIAAVVKSARSDENRLADTATHASQTRKPTR